MEFRLCFGPLCTRLRGDQRPKSEPGIFAQTAFFTAYGGLWFGDFGGGGGMFETQPLPTRNSSATWTSALFVLFVVRHTLPHMRLHHSLGAFAARRIAWRVAGELRRNRLGRFGGRVGAMVDDLRGFQPLGLLDA